MFMIALHGRLWFCLTWDVFVCVLIVGWFYLQVKVQRERDCEVKMGSPCSLRVSMHMFWVKIVSLWSKICVCTLWISTVYEMCHFMNSPHLTHAQEIGIVTVICIVCNKEKRKCRKITKFPGFPKRYPDSIWVVKERICGVQLLLIFLNLLIIARDHNKTSENSITHSWRISTHTFSFRCKGLRVEIFPLLL